MTGNQDQGATRGKSGDNSVKSIKSLPAQIDLPAMESQILQYWQKNNIFEKSVSTRDGSPRWSFYEGPPTANGKPGTHHIEARVLRIFFLAFKQ
jgi:isoleucyl-tRNA synthetase